VTPERVGVAITRPAADAEWLADRVERLGLRPVMAPLLRVALRESASLATALRASPPPAWLVCTSRHAVEAVAQACRYAGVSPAEALPQSVAAVGAGTAQSLESLGVAVRVTPEHADADHLVDMMLQLAEGRPSHALFPCGSEARDVVPRRLRGAGWDVDAVVCYDTLPLAEVGEGGLAERIERGEVHIVTLASGSAARAFARAVPPGLWSRVRLVSIGSSTTDAARASGLTIDTESRSPGLSGLAEAVHRAYIESYSHA